jgi:hypothetical protein
VGVEAQHAQTTIDTIRIKGYLQPVVVRQSSVVKPRDDPPNAPHECEVEARLLLGERNWARPRTMVRMAVELQSGVAITIKHRS